MASPFCAQPINLTATETPFLVKNPLLSASAIAQISPRTEEERFAPPNILTATSPVMTPNFCGSFLVNIWLTSVVSPGVGVKLSVEDILPAR